MIQTLGENQEERWAIYLLTLSLRVDTGQWCFPWFTIFVFAINPVNVNKSYLIRLERMEVTQTGT